MSVESTNSAESKRSANSTRSAESPKRLAQSSRSAESRRSAESKVSTRLAESKRSAASRESTRLAESKVSTRSAASKESTRVAESKTSKKPTGPKEFTESKTSKEFKKPKEVAKTTEAKKRPRKEVAKTTEESAASKDYTGAASQQREETGISLRPRAGTAPGTSKVRSGDWTCPKCGNYNWAIRGFCNKKAPAHSSANMRSTARLSPRSSLPLGGTTPPLFTPPPFRQSMVRTDGRQRVCGFRASIVGKRAIGTSTPSAGIGIANAATTTSTTARSAIVRVATVRS